MLRLVGLPNQADEVESTYVQGNINYTRIAALIVCSGGFRVVPRVLHALIIMLYSRSKDLYTDCKLS